MIQTHQIPGHSSPEGLPVKLKTGKYLKPAINLLFTTTKMKG